MSIHIFDAYVQFGFMRRSIFACIALSLSLPPLGIFLLLRRMSLVGDALSHAVLPGVAIGYLFSGMSLLFMGIGGFIAGLFVTLLSGVISRKSRLNEDSTFAALYLGSLALGVILVSYRKNSIDLLHLLFGSLLAVDNGSLIFIGSVVTITLLVIGLLYRPIVYESFNSSFFTIRSPRYSTYIHGLFMGLVVLNLIAGFQVLGTLMSVGLMMLPAISARCWTDRLINMMILSVIIGILSSLIGLTWSWYQSIPAGPAIILSATVFLLYLFYPEIKKAY
ncbi:metal ABC transporter permease [Vibrio artabrorum]|uniref:Metal ABC transporter permease n=1 Tax=Vibrio artabrorum TaxID=446374 RepID=A0ABT8CEJ1_9VIBR|nr:metal ABC transporter permease [Vibrio artabrorum]MDN3700131.1 metal ABC transporter permease [Vibrio artabrorum]